MSANNLVRHMKWVWSICFLFLSISLSAKGSWINDYDVIWNTQSKSSMQSMPCGGAGIGLNVWVENDQVYVLIGSTDSWVETPLRQHPFEYVMRKTGKLGRLKISVPEGMFSGSFKQRLDLSSNSIIIEGEDLNKKQIAMQIWVDYYSPVIHIEGNSNFLTDDMKVALEYWRGTARYQGEAIEWGYRNEDPALNSRVYYISSRNLQSMADIIPDLFTGLTFGGRLSGKNFVEGDTTTCTYGTIASKSIQLKQQQSSDSFHLQVTLQVNKTESLEQFFKTVESLDRKKWSTLDTDRQKTQQAWSNRWKKSYIRINPSKDSTDLGWQVGRNYQLFRAMLAVNNLGKFPTLFNGGPFTCQEDPELRNWDWSEYMGQNQRLVYWPMLRAGDEDLLRVALDFYKDRTPVCAKWADLFWQIKGHFYPEDMSVFGLPVYPTTPQGFSSPDCLTYHFTSGMEFALMMLEYQRYTGENIDMYLPCVIGLLQAYDGFYRKQCKEKTGKELDQNNRYVLYPGNGVELYTDTKNDAATIAGLMALSNGLLALPDSMLKAEQRKFVEDFSMRLPQIPHRIIRGHETIAPADSWLKERADTNMEMPHLYPLFPFGIFSIGRPDFDLARNTWEYGYFKKEYQRRAFCWYQGGIFTARLGMAEEAREYAIAKFLYPLRQKEEENGVGFDRNLTPGRTRYPAFWDTGSFCEVPDMDHGGSAMVGLQEMLLQTELPGEDGYGKEFGKQIYLFPAWPKDWDVEFKLCAPYNTTVECSYVKGKIKKLKVTPESRRKDVIIMLQTDK